MEHRVRLAELFDAEIRAHNEHFRSAAAIRPGERVLDIGCGTGESTREAAATALDFAMGLRVNELAVAKDPAALDRVRAAIATHDPGHGVHFDSRAWIVTAVR